MLSKIGPDDILNFHLIFFRENTTSHFIWIICLAADSQEVGIKQKSALDT